MIADVTPKDEIEFVGVDFGHNFLISRCRLFHSKKQGPSDSLRGEK
jgi:hypothetical protein